MPAGFPAFPRSTFPNDKPPTLFHPASPKNKPAKPEKAAKDADAASMASTSTFSSTVSLLKENVKSKFSTHKKAPASEKRPSSTSYADLVNGEHKTRRSTPNSKYMTRTLSSTSEREEDKSKALKDFILMRDENED